MNNRVLDSRFAFKRVEVEQCGHLFSEQSHFPTAHRVFAVIVTSPKELILFINSNALSATPYKIGQHHTGILQP